MRGSAHILMMDDREQTKKRCSSAWRAAAR
jgi:hypothetical protein